MTANTGRTHAKYIQVYLDNVSGTLTELTAYCNTVGTVGLTYEESDVTAFSDGSMNIVIGRPEAPITIGGPFDTVLHSHMTALTTASAINTPLSFDIRVGIRHAWEAGEPQFGITSSSTVGYLVSSYLPNLDDMTWTATLNVVGSTAPAWGTAAET